MIVPLRINSSLLYSDGAVSDLDLGNDVQIQAESPVNRMMLVSRLISVNHSNWIDQLQLLRWVPVPDEKGTTASQHQQCGTLGLEG